MICVAIWEAIIYTHSTIETAFVGVAINYHKYWLAARHYAYNRITNNKLAFFQNVLIFSDGKQSFEPCLIILLGVLLFCLDTVLAHTVARRKYKVHL